MNFIQRNPDDPKHAEFHDGEYEFWPTSGSTKGKSISIPAAVVSGLELLAATAAAGLLALAVSAMYVSSAPRTITMDSAVINAEVYNNVSDDMVAYSLSLNADPRIIYQEGVLDDDSDTLFLQNLSGGTTYLLQYYDEENKEIGEFRFTTPGEQPEGGPPVPQTPQPEQQPQEPQLPAEDPVTPAPEEENPVSPETGPTVETKPEEEEEKPPVIIPPTPRPTPVPTPDPDPDPTLTPDPTPTPTPNPEPGPERVEDPVSLAEYIQPISGSVEGAYFSYAHVHAFQNLSGDYKVSVTRNGVALGANTYEITFIDGILYVRIIDEIPGDYEVSVTRNGVGGYGITPVDGSLTVEITDTVLPGESSSTTVTVKNDASTLVQSDIRTAPPSLDSVVMTAEKLEDGYLFHITANVSPDDAEDMICSAQLFINSDGKIDVSMTKGSGNTYVGTYKAEGLTGSGQADVYVNGTCPDYPAYKPTATIQTFLYYGP